MLRNKARTTMAMAAATMAATAALLVGGGGTAAADAPPEVSASKIFRCYDLLWQAKAAVGAMTSANADMAEAAARGDGEAYAEAAQDYDDALTDYGQAATRYRSNDCYWVIGHKLPLAPPRYTG